MINTDAELFAKNQLKLVVYYPDRKCNMHSKNFGFRFFHCVDHLIRIREPYRSCIFDVSILLVIIVTAIYNSISQNK